MSNGKTQEACERLVLLKKGGKAFSENLKELISYQSKLKSFYAEAEVNSKKDTVDCTLRLLELMEKRATLLSDLERNTILSFYFKSKLQMSEQELRIMSQAAKIIS